MGGGVVVGGSSVGTSVAWMVEGEVVPLGGGGGRDHSSVLPPFFGLVAGLVRASLVEWQSLLGL